MAERGKVDYDQIRLGARNGSGTQVQMFGGGTVTPGHVAIFSASGDVVDGGGSSAATVTSVGLAMPPEFTVTGSPVTTTGTLTAVKASQAGNLIYASPSGSSGQPVFRSLTLADMPSGIGAVTSVFGRTGAVTAATGDYTVSQVTGAAASGTTITAGAGLTGGGDLSANRTLAVVPATATVLGGVKIGANISVAADGTISVSAAGTGTVTSVGMTVPARQTVTGSPVTTSGTLAITDNAQAVNLVFAGPTSGAAAVPTFRSLVAADFSSTVISGFQTPWLQPVSAAGNALSNVPTVSGNGNITLASGGAGSLTLQTNALTRVTVNSAGQVGIGTGTPAYAVDVAGDVNVSGAFRINGTAITGSQTPWVQNINAAGYTLSNVPTVSGNSASPGLTLASGGAGALTLQTSTKTRLQIDSAGHATISAPDDTGIPLKVIGNGIMSGAAVNPSIFVQDNGTNYATFALASAAGNWVTGSGVNDLVIFNGNASAGVSIGTNSTTRLRIDATGNVGIGTTAPGYALDVKASAGYVARFTSTLANCALLKFTGNAAGVDLWAIGTDISASANKDFLFYNLELNAERMRITNTGNVGIGTTSPACLLDIEAGSNLGTSLRVGNAQGFINLSGGDGVKAWIDVPSWSLSLRTNGVDRVYITNGGNVGIGTTNPAEQLHLGGYGAVAMLTGNATSFLTHQYLNTSAEDVLSLSVNYRRTDTNAGTIQGSSIGSAEILVASSGNNSVIRLRTSPTSNSAPVDCMVIGRAGAVQIPNLPSANPGAGTKQLWYDPADSNRVKFAA